MTSDGSRGQFVQGVNGPVAAADLGVTQCHEHVSIDITRINNDDAYRLDDLALVGGDLAVAAAAGLRTVVDAGTDGHRRSPAFLAEVARGTGINVVAATGFWKEVAYPAFFDASSAGELADRLIGDITAGIAGTGVRAGVIGEMGTEAGGFTARTEKAFRACALAQRETGVAIITHTAEGDAALAQLDLLTSCGVDPGRIVIGHVDCLDDPKVHREIARRGAFVGFDRVGAVRFASDDVRLRLTLELLDAGYAGQLILSCDLASRSRLREAGELGYAHLLEGFLPRLRAAGVGEDTIHQVMTGNPARLLTGATPG